MGIIQQQTLKGTFYSYLGVLIGFFAAYLIQPHVLSPEQVGLIGLLTTFSILFAQISVLGFNATARIFPYFRNPQNHDNGYLGLAFLISISGFVLFCIAAYFLKDQIVQDKNGQGNLFATYYWQLIPLTFFTMVFNILELYSRMQYDTTIGKVLKEFTNRLLVLGALLLLLIKSVSFETFMWIWLIVNIIPTGMIAYRLHKRNQLSFRLNLGFIDKSLKRQIIHLCFFGILTGTAPFVIQNIDRYMINEEFGLTSTGVYTLAFTIGSIISLPARSLYSISYTVIAEAWKNENTQEIKSIYKKSCINQLIATLFLFLLIWANIHNIYYILPAAYDSGQYVIFFIGIGYLIEASTGVNGVIVATSKFYKYESYFSLAMIAVTIIANLILIPRYGITGAAIASAVTLLIFNLSRYLFILFVFKMQAFTYKTPLTIITGIAVYLFVNAIPALSNFIVDGVLRTGLITLLFCGTAYYLSLSEDINNLIESLINKHLKRNK